MHFLLLCLLALCASALAQGPPFNPNAPPFVRAACNLATVQTFPLNRTGQANLYGFSNPDIVRIAKNGFNTFAVAAGGLVQILDGVAIAPGNNDRGFTFSATQTLQPTAAQIPTSDTLGLRSFGWGISLTNTSNTPRLAIGAPLVFNTNLVALQGAAWIYDYNAASGQYLLTQALATNNTEPQDGALYGSEIRVVGNTLLLSSTGCCGTNNHRGRVYPFTFNGAWSAYGPVGGLAAPGTLRDGDNYGGQISVTPNMLLIAAPNSRSNGVGGVGSTFPNAWDSTTISFQSNIISVLSYSPLTFQPGPDAGSECGTIMTQLGPNLRYAFSCPGFQNGTGLVYIAQQLGTSVQIVTQVGAPNPQVGSNFGVSLDLDLDTLVVGDRFGNVYFFYRVSQFDGKDRYQLVQTLNFQLANGTNPGDKSAGYAVSLNLTSLAITSVDRTVIYTCPVGSPAAVLLANLPLVFLFAFLLSMLM